MAPVERSRSAQDQANAHALQGGQPVHSFATRLAELTTVVSNTCRTPFAAPDAPAFHPLTTASANHRRALALIGASHPQSETQTRK